VLPHRTCCQPLARNSLVAGRRVRVSAGRPAVGGGIPHRKPSERPAAFPAEGPPSPAWRSSVALSAEPCRRASLQLLKRRPSFRRRPAARPTSRLPLVPANFRVQPGVQLEGGAPFPSRPPFPGRPGARFFVRVGRLTGTKQRANVENPSPSVLSRTRKPVHQPRIRSVPAGPVSHRRVPPQTVERPCAPT